MEYQTEATIAALQRRTRWFPGLLLFGMLLPLIGGCARPRQQAGALGAASARAPADATTPSRATPMLAQVSPTRLTAPSQTAAPTLGLEEVTATPAAAVATSSEASPTPTQTAAPSATITTTPMVDPPTAEATASLPVAPVQGARAPDFVLPALDGAEISLAGLRGSRVLLNFWTTW
jgi:hypothetical protein